MPWSDKQHPEYELIEMVYKGCITLDDMNSAGMKTKAVAEELGINRFLLDLNDVEAFDVSTFDLYDRPEQWRGLRAKSKNRLALHVPDSKEIMKAARFYETVCRNRGWNVQIFSQRQEAIDWLMT